MKKFLAGIADIIGAFLIQNGGLYSGLETFAYGVIQYNASGGLTISVKKDMDFAETRELANELEYKIKDYIVKSRFARHTITVSAMKVDGSDNCYRTTVSFIEQVPVTLPIPPKSK